MTDDHDSLRDDLAAWRDGELPPARRVEVERALRDDPALRAELAELERVDALYREAPADTLPADFTSRVRAAIREEPAQGEAGPARELWQERRYRSRLALWPLAAAAAVLLAAVGVWAALQQTGTAPMDLARHEAAEDAAPPPADGIPEPEASAMAGAREEDRTGEPLADIADERATALRMDAAHGAREPVAPPRLGTPRAPTPEAAEADAHPRARVLSEPQAEAEAPLAKAESLPAEPAPQAGVGPAEDAAAFALEDGVWVETGYAGEETATAERDGEAARARAEDDPGFRALLERPRAIVFQWENRWLRIPAADEAGPAPAP